MIIDELWNQGLSKVIGDQYPHMIKVPFPVGSKQNSSDTLLDTILKSACRDKSNPSLGLNPEGVRMPYDCCILFHSKADNGCITVVRSTEYSGHAYEIKGVHVQSVEAWSIIGLYMIYGRLVPIMIKIGVAKDHDGSERLCIENVEPTSYVSHFHKIVSVMHGEHVARQMSGHLTQSIATSEGRADFEEKTKSATRFITYITFATFLLMSARNIETITHTPDVKLNRSRIKKGKLPMFQWKELVLSPTKKGSSEKTTTSSLETLPIHWVRGHFKTYTAENPLFGKYTGRYWWQPHMAGRDSTRFVEKTYKVEA